MAVPAGAQVWVSGRPDAVRVEANNVSLEEVLTSLQTKFNLRYRASGTLERSITGSYDGSLRYVAIRLLAGYDFVLKIEPDGMEALIWRQSRPDDKPLVVKALPASDNPAGPIVRAPVMTAAEATRNERSQFR
ncbi:MAG TPA: hypothetical protein VGF53_03955 [Pseudolabrys sp.]